MTEANPLTKLREPFPASQVGKLPRIICPNCQKAPTKVCQEHSKSKCSECDNYITGRHIHLDYVGHGAVTDRLLEVDPAWNWEPLGLDPNGMPAFEQTPKGDRVGLWIRLTVAGVTRLGYGSCPDGQHDAEKVLIGDCLAEGTVIETADGAKPIEDVEIGDLVPTRLGWHRVSDHWLSAESAPVVAVLLDDGGVLVGTPHHRVPTATGPKHMGTLRNGDMLYEWQGIGASQARLKSPGTAVATAGTLAPPTATIASTGSPRQPLGPTCTETSTSTSTGAYRRAGTCTTATATRSTTTPATWSPSPATSTRRSTTPSGRDALMSATSAAPSSPPASGPTTFAGARRLARSAGAVELVLPTSGPGRVPTRTIATATSAGLASKRPSRGSGSALRRVVAVLDAGVAPVWNLSVEHVHEYVANGVYVHNSLRNAAMRFGVALELWIKGHGEDDERKTALAQRATSADEPADPAPLAEGEMLSRDAKGRVAAACGGDKELATQAWQAAGLHEPFDNGRPRWKVTQSELDQAIAEAARLTEAAAEGVAQAEQQEQPELPDVDNGKKAYDEASREAQR